jgi:hypothetical protein
MKTLTRAQMKRAANALLDAGDAKNSGSFKALAKVYNVPAHEIDYRSPRTPAAAEYSGSFQETCRIEASILYSEAHR